MTTTLGGITTITLIMITPSVNTINYLLQSFINWDQSTSFVLQIEKRFKKHLLCTHNKNDCGQTGNSAVRSLQVNSISIPGSDFSFLCGSSLHQATRWPLLSPQQSCLEPEYSVKTVNDDWWGADGQSTWAKVDSFHLVVRLCHCVI